MNSLSELKKIIQAMNDGTVTDNDITAFQNEVFRLGKQHENNPVITPLLKMMHPLGTYIGSKKETVHADSIPAITSIVQTLEKIISTDDKGTDAARQMLAREITSFNSLKNKIASRPEIDENDMNDLKAVILAIDWEISRTTLRNFETVLTHLMSKLKPYKIHHTFLRIIHTTGRFIGVQKANAPTDSIAFLRSVFENFERVVQAPDMAFKDKKKILENDINRFHEFKQTISRNKTAAPQKTDSAKDTSEEDTLQPALSHVQSKTGQDSDDIVPLTPLPEKEEEALPAGNEPDDDPVKPALAGRKKSPAAGQDVMDDLFSVKESPADELLDAIHLMDVHGPNQGQSMNMADETADLQSQGIKNYTPRQKDNAPIPEIGNRLDEFFSLDVSDGTPAGNDELQELPLGDITLAGDEPVEDEPAESIVPFQPEDESVEQSQAISDEKQLLPENQDAVILNRLKSTIQDSEWLRYEASMLSVTDDISYLEKTWEDDPDKTGLLEIIVSIVNQLKSQSTALQQTDESLINGMDHGFPDPRAETTKGFWGKIKGMFAS